jgi:predicted nucleic acid-binding protein
MRLFLDTSVLFKLYHRETDTAEFELIFSNFRITNVLLSEIAKIEFASTIWKKVRTGEITPEQANVTLQLFTNDFEKYTFVSTDSLVLEQAKKLVTEYGIHGLRTLDSIQLATAVLLSHQADLFLTADKLLKSFMQSEGLLVEMPEG